MRHWTPLWHWHWQKEDDTNESFDAPRVQPQVPSQNVTDHTNLRVHHFQCTVHNCTCSLFESEKHFCHILYESCCNSMSLLIKTPWAVKCFASMLECHCWAPAAHSPEEHTQAFVASNHVLQTFCKGLHALHTGQEIRWHLKHELCCLSDCIFPTSDLTQECCGDPFKILNEICWGPNWIQEIKYKRFFQIMLVVLFPQQNRCCRIQCTFPVSPRQELSVHMRIGELGLRNALFAC